MLRRSLPLFFISNNVRYVRNSAKHVALQVDIGREASVLRNANEELAKLTEWENLIFELEVANYFFKTKKSYSEDEINQFTRTVNVIRDVVSCKKERFSLEKVKCSEKIIGLLKEIKAEVAAEDVVSSDIKGMRK